MDERLRQVDWEGRHVFFTIVTCGADRFHGERPEEIRPVLQAVSSSPGRAGVEAVFDPEGKPAKPDELRA